MKFSLTDATKLGAITFLLGAVLYTYYQQPSALIKTFPFFGGAAAGTAYTIEYNRKVQPKGSVLQYVANAYIFQPAILVLAAIGSLLMMYDVVNTLSFSR